MLKPTTTIHFSNAFNLTTHPISEAVYTHQNSFYISTLLFSIQNIRFVSPSMPKPSFIVTPFTDSHIQAVVQCSKASGLQIRTRCGGHDYEGLSYSSKLPFVIIDMKNLSSIQTDAETRVAWVEGGALLGNLSYQIAPSPTASAPPWGWAATSAAEATARC